MSIHDENTSSLSGTETENERSSEAENTDDSTVHASVEESTESVEDLKDTASEVPKKEKDALAVPKVIFEYLEMFATAICIVLLLSMFIVRFCDVKGPSMEPTLYEGEKLIVSDLFYTPERGDIVIFHQTGALNEPIVKRVIATGGEWVKVDFQERPQKITVSVYDKNKNLIEVLDESSYAYLDPTQEIVKFQDSKNLYTADSEGRIYIPEGYLFVLGDNRNHSADSRNTDVIGLVDERRVLGKVICRVYPFSKAGSVD